MRFPWANIVLFVLLVVQLVTGYLGLTNGRSQFNWVLWLHGIGAYGLLVVLLWKGSIIWHAVRRKTVWTRARLGFLGLLVLLIVTIVTGLLWTLDGPIYVGGFSLVSLHIYIAIPLMLLMVWHAWRMRFVLRLRETWSRRLFAGTAVAAAAGWLLWRGAAWLKARIPLEGAARRFTGSYETGSFTGRFPSFSWIADRPAPVDATAWELVVEGEVERPLTFTYDHLLQLATDEQTATLDCTGGWYSTQIWHGVAVRRLLEMAGLRTTARSITFEAVSGYKRRFSLEESEEYLLACYVAGQTLTHGHGFPARLVAHNQRGVEWVKWVARIRVNATSHLLQAPLPLQ